MRSSCCLDSLQDEEPATPPGGDSWRSSGGGDAAGERNMNNNVFIFNIHGYKKLTLDAEYKYFTSFLSFTSLYDMKRFLHLN